MLEGMRKRPIRFLFKDQALTALSSENRELAVAQSLTRRLGTEVTLWPVTSDEASITCRASYFADDVFHQEPVVISKL
jgi:hypothetical protein